MFSGDALLLLITGFLELTLFELNILRLCGFGHFQFIFFLVSLIIFISSVCRGRGREREEVKGGGGLSVSGCRYGSLGIRSHSRSSNILPCTSWMFLCLSLSRRYLLSDYKAVVTFRMSNRKQRRDESLDKTFIKFLFF